MPGPIKGPNDNKPENKPVLFLHQAMHKAFIHPELQAHASSGQQEETTKPETMLKRETSLLEQSVRSAILIMRGMYAQLMVLNIDTLEAKAERQKLITEIQKLESGLESFTNSVSALDKGAVSRTMPTSEALKAKLENIRATVSDLEKLVIPGHEQDVLNMSPASKFAILSNMLNEAIGIASKNLRLLDSSVFKKARL